MTAVTPSLRRRIAVMVYEAILLFGVLFIADWLFDTLTQSRHALKFRAVRQLWLFAVLGGYFVYCWTHSGQTLAMKTWRVRLVAPGQRKVPLTRGVARYVLAWMWFVPALAIDYLLHLQAWTMVSAVAIGMIAWALAILLNKDRQFLHDVLAGTRLVYEAPATMPAPAEPAT